MHQITWCILMVTNFLGHTNPNEPDKLEKHHKPTAPT